MLAVWVPANHGALIDLSGVKAEDSVTVTGIVTSYQDNADDPIVWQLIPRDAGDVQVSSRPDTLPAWALWAAIGVAAAIARSSAARLLGVANESALAGRTITDFIDVSSRAALTPVASGEETTAEPVARARARMLSAEGHAVDVEVTTSPCLSHDRPAVVVLARDITSQLRYEHDLHSLALVDELTGLQNRRGFARFAEQERARSRRNKLTPVLLFADLDDLKAINDQYGHGAGDAAIRKVATALKQTLRETDIIARWSGDEFVALMTEGGMAEAEQLEQRLDGAIAELAPDAQPFTVTASVGKTTLNPTLSLRDAMDRSDAELYAKKKLSLGRRGRNTPVGIDGIAQDR
jgi:diguanylate cyclase (GGDEF)-like protein/PAS domain S-box-containing protein